MYASVIQQIGPSIAVCSCFQILIEHMHQLFNRDSSCLIAGIFRCLLELGEQNDIDRSPQSLLPIILSIVLDRNKYVYIYKLANNILLNT